MHLDFKEVIPFASEPIIKQDGQTKNDCERNAAKHFFDKLERDHPRLPLIIIEDGLSSNTPHIRKIEKHGWLYILGVKPSDHISLFKKAENARQNSLSTEFEYVNPDKLEVLHTHLHLVLYTWSLHLVDHT